MDIAVIGMAGRFPGADNIDELFSNLANGVDSIRGISAARIKDTALPEGKAYRNCGYLEDVDKFDYRFFGISYAEAKDMCPSQRLLLETAYATFEDAGYNPDRLDGSATSVYTADGGVYYYYRHAEKLTSTLITGNSQEFSPARISRYFNLAGNSMAINTACSSSVTAIHFACNELRLGEADYSLVCSINLDLFPFDEYDSDIKLTSPDGRSKAFSAQSEGISFGETVCAVLLKPLDKALQDQDNIHAVIKGSSNNNNGSLSASMLAPSSERESQAIKLAWDRAGVTPADLGFIEAHGSGTQIGDSLEIEALSLATRMSGAVDLSIPIGTIKSNIGHCMFAAGMVGLIKTILSLKHHVIFPTIHCTELNPNIDFAHAPVYVNTALAAWRSQPDTETRYASVNSLGRSGGNSHIVLRNHPYPATAIVKQRELFTLSSRTSQGLQENKERLAGFLQAHPDASLADISYTLNAGRKHYEHRYAVTAASVSELLNGLKATTTHAAVAAQKIFLVFSDQADLPAGWIGLFAARFPVIEKALPAAADHAHPFVRSFLFQYTLFLLLRHWGLDGKHLISFGLGKIARDAALERITIEEGLLQAQRYIPEPLHDLPAKVSKLMAGEKGSVITLMDLGMESPITAAFRLAYADRVQLFSLDNGEDCIVNWLKELYTGIPAIDWSLVAAGQAGRKISLPAYAFERTRCWLRDEPHPSYRASKKAKEQPVAETTAVSTGNTREDVILAVFRSLLKRQDIAAVASIFKMGADDAMVLQAATMINQQLQTGITAGDLYCYPSAAALAAHATERPATLSIVKAVWALVFNEEQIADHADFFDIGGHSLMAAQIIQKMKKIFPLKLNFDDIFQYPTPAELAAYIDQLMPAKTEQPVAVPPVVPAELPRAEKRQYYPVSHAQRRILMLEKLYKNAVSYNMPREFIIEGQLDTARLRHAFDQLIQRHEILRTAFFFIDGKPFQKPCAIASAPVELYDLSAKGLTEEELEQEARQIFRQHLKPFDLAIPPLLRVVVVKINPGKWLLTFDISHIAVDRQGYEVLAADFLRLYLQQSLEPVRHQYRDYAVLQQKALQQTVTQESEAFWMDLFRDPLAGAELPADFTRPEEPDNAGRMISFSLPAALSDKLVQLARHENVTPYVLLLAAFKVWVHRLTGSEDICIGLPFSERSNASLQNMAGILLNTIVVRTRPGKGKRFSDYLQEVMNISTGAYKHGSYQFETLLEKLKFKREKNRNPVFDILFNSQTIAGNGEAAALPAGEIRFRPRSAEDNTATFDLTIMVDTTGQQADFLVYYKTSLFREATVRYYFNQYILLLEQIAADSSLALGAYSVFDRKNIQRRQPADNIIAG